MKRLIFQSPEIAHAVKIRKLVEDNEKLDSNSQYYYLMWCKEFSDTSAIAIKEDEFFLLLLVLEDLLPRILIFFGKLQQKSMAYRTQASI